MAKYSDRCLEEVENAAALIRSVALGKTISQVQTNEDAIVYTGTSHEEFVSRSICCFETRSLTERLVG
jgi:hypothetical protein